MARRALGVCAEADCPELTAARRCPTHAAQREHARGTRQQRGYDHAHLRIRARLLANLIPGTPCPKCKQPMWPNERLDAGHSQDLRDNPNSRADQLEHASCNRAWRRTT